MFPIGALLLAMAQPAGIDACVESSSEPTTIATVSADPDGFAGRCVTVSGPVRASALVGGGETMADGLPRERIGLYEERLALRSHPELLTTRWMVTGVVDSCRAIAGQVRATYDQQAREAVAAGRIVPPPPMLAGFCHYYDGAVIWVSRFRRREPSG